MSTITVRLMTDADVDATASLYQANARDALSAQQRAQNGFVQGRLGPEALHRAVGDKHAFVAEIDGQLAGATLIHPVDRFAAGPAAEPSSKPQHPAAATVAAAQQAEVEQPVLYGPSVVAAEFRRRGVLQALTQAVFTAAAQSGYRTVVAFMEKENQASVKAHAQLGWQPIGGFTFDGREYDVVTHPADEASM